MYCSWHVREVQSQEPTTIFAGRTAAPRSRWSHTKKHCVGAKSNFPKLAKPSNKP